MNTRFPLQPVIMDEHRVARFRENKVVRFLLDNGSLDLNHLATSTSREAHREDWEQFVQLIGYSVSGASEWECFSDEAFSTAQAMVENPALTPEQSRIAYLQSTLAAVREGLKQVVPVVFRIHPDDLDKI